MNTVKLSDNHLILISAALETYYRLKSGQVGIALDIAYNNSLSWEDREEIEKKVKSLSFPELGGSFYSFNSPQIGDARLAYEIQKTFDEFLSVKKNDGYYGSGRNFDGPLKATDEPLPEIENFLKYKGFPLDPKISDKVIKLCDKKKFEEAWRLIDTLKLPKGEKREIKIIDSLNGREAFVVVWKPRKD